MKRYADLIGNYKNARIKNLADNKMIGRFAALAVANTVYINSYYNNVKYSYVMYKNGTGINIDLLGSIQGNFKNGVEINVIVNISDDALCDAILTLCYFKKLHVEYTGEISSYRLKDTIERFNDRTIKEYMHFCECEAVPRYPCKIRVGNVLYNFERTDIPWAYERNITLRFNIGELDITPNREQVQKTPRSIQAIQEKLKLATQEYNEEVKKYITQLNTSFHSFRDVILWFQYNRYTYLNPEIKVIKIEIDDIIKLGGIKFNENEVPQNILNALTINHFPITVSKSNASFVTRCGVNSKEYALSKFIATKIYIQKDSRLKQITKDYYDSINKDSYIILKDKSFNALLKQCINYFDIDIVKYYIKNIDVKEIANDLVPVTFKPHINTIDAYTSSNKQTLSSYRKYIAGKYVVNPIRNVKEFCSQKQTVIYSENTKTDGNLRALSIILHKYIRNDKILVCTISKDLVPLIKNKRPFIHIDDYLSKFRRPISKWVTSRYMSYEKQKYTDPYRYYSDLLPVKNVDFYNGYRNKYYASLENETKNCSNALDIYNTYIKNKWLDYGALESFYPTDRELKFYIIKRTMACCTSDVLILYLTKRFGICNNKNVLASIKDINNYIDKGIKIYESIQTKQLDNPLILNR